MNLTPEKSDYNLSILEFKVCFKRLTRAKTIIL